MDDERPRERRERTRRRRRAAGFALLAAPTAWVVATDVLRRAGRIVHFDKIHFEGYVASILASFVFWSVILFVASRRRGGLAGFASVLFFVLFTIAMGVEGAFHAFYNIYLSIDGQLHSKSIPWSIVGSLPLSRPVVVFHLALAALLAGGLLYGGKKLLRPGALPTRAVAVLLPVVLYGAIRIPVSYRSIQSSPFDLIYFHGMTALVKERLGYTHDSPDLRVQKRTPMDVPRMAARPARPRNVLLVLQESQRFDVTCNDYDPDCELATRFSNREVPDRMPLNEMRANDSTTAISIANIWGGVMPTEGRELMHSVPLLWEYAHAAGYDTAYWTSQNLMFGNARLYVQDIPVSHRCVATELDSEADLDAGASDGLLADRVIHEWNELKEPFFAVVHFSNIHFPYVYDPADAPFQPAEMDKSPEKNEEFKNYYKDVVYHSDKSVGRLLHYIKGTESGKRTVIVYTSDHGESFREHWQLGHTSSVYEEEIRVPAWVDAPPGTLSEGERESIAAARDEMVWHLDLTPTFLDLLGLWDAPEMRPFRARMPGHPITRRERTIGPVVLTNCTWVWECAFRNWGMMLGPMKIEAREWDGEYHCFDVTSDPDEIDNLGEDACAPLPGIARRIFHVMPNDIPPGRPKVDWGKK
ncbi:MAG TPA: sulfatase-like hydrolase/transferase [Minicystis sp.]|nr:sulfatase-like hydrolase/transferase [Minicystis sp.]